MRKRRPPSPSHHHLTLTILFTLTTTSSALQIAPFFPPEQHVLPLSSSNTSSSISSDDYIHLTKRSTTCAKNFLPCDYMNILGYCCPSSAQCGLDPAGHVACCPIGAACTGLVTGVGSLGTSTAIQSTVASEAIVTAAPAVTASFVQNASPSSALTTSYLSNAYFAYPVIPTTYANAASCSAAWTACQTDLAKCTNYLAPGSGASGTIGLPGMSVTISAPNYVTATTASAGTTYALLTAQAICTSLSSIACSGLQVSACTVFDGANAARPVQTAMPGMAVVGAMALGGLMMV